MGFRGLVREPLKRLSQSTPSPPPLEPHPLTHSLPKSFLLMEEIPSAPSGILRGFPPKPIHFPNSIRSKREHLKAQKRGVDCDKACRQTGHKLPFAGSTRDCEAGLVAPVTARRQSSMVRASIGRATCLIHITLPANHAAGVCSLYRHLGLNPVPCTQHSVAYPAPQYRRK